MKVEYKETVLSWIDGVNTRNKVIQQMLNGQAPANQERAILLTKEIERLMEQIQNIVEIS